MSVENKEKLSCPVAGKCGGCQLLHLSYAEQLKKKQKRLMQLCGKFGKFEPIIGMKQSYYYRNKVHAAFGEDRKHHIISGIYEESTHRIVPVDSCLLENQKADAIIVTIRKLAASFQIPVYHEKSGYGLLRHVLIRTGCFSGQIMVVLVLTSPVFPSKNNFVKALLREHPEITTIVLNVNHRYTSMVLGDKEQVIYGKGYIEDELLGKTFRISARSFYQVNPRQTQKLYAKALEYADLHGEETVWDLYCGIGTISLFLAGYAKQVYGVEIVEQAILDARENARRNHIENARFFVGKAEEVLPEFYAQQKDSPEDMLHPNVIVVDPPRKGCDRLCLDTMIKMQPERIVYVSCDSATLARDLRILCDGGYRIERIRGVDQFGMTVHVESVILMQYCGKEKK